MRVRLHGTPDEVSTFAAALRECFEVIEESRDVRDRTPSRLVRRYLDIRLGVEPDKPTITG